MTLLPLLGVLYQQHFKPYTLEFINATIIRAWDFVGEEHTTRARV